MTTETADRQIHDRASTRADPMNLCDRTIIVTGAAQGIGFSVAELVLKLGGDVVIVDRNADALTAAHDALSSERVMMMAGDITDVDFAEAVVSRAVDRFGAVHGLVNNAGFTRPAMVTKLDLEAWRQVLDVHLTGAFLFVQAVARHMIERYETGDVTPGAIVNISSDAGVQGTIGQANYSAAKAGVLGLSMSAARELARYGIRVNTVAFGMVETPMTEVIRGEKFRETYLSRIPLQRWSAPAEAAKPVCFLLSDAASYVTGQRLSVNGGSQMCA
jgi:3-oxoacyl-[acyl-carrier protein] reductase